MICYVSKLSEAAAIPDTSAVSVANFVLTTICRLGVMDNVISD